MQVPFYEKLGTLLVHDVAIMSGKSQYFRRLVTKSDFLGFPAVLRIRFRDPVPL
jgi:hypothetical protein